MLKILDVAKYLLDSEKYSEKILNHPISQVCKWTHDLAEFWKKWECVDPTHTVFKDHGNELDHCIPCMLHGDEGTGHRRKPVLQLSWGFIAAGWKERVGENVSDYIMCA